MSEKKINLMDEGTGLLRTHVPKELIESIMQKKLHTNAKFGEDWTAKSIADGVGFVSIVGLIEPKWTEDAEILPEKFIVKMPTCINTMKMVEAMKNDMDSTQEETDEMMTKWQASIRKMHNSEATFYEYLGEKGENDEKLKLPKIYFLRKFENNDDLIGFIIMEYLDDFKISHLYDILSVEKAEQALKAWAKIQAFTSNEEFLSKDFFKENSYRELYEKLMGLKDLQKMTLMVGKFYPELMELCEKVKEISEEIYDLNEYEREPEKRGMKPILAHGDLWATNVLWRKSDDSLRSLIDFQIVHRGSPGEDIARFLTTSMSGADRREHENYLLERYHGYFAEFLNGREMPFTVEQLKANYRGVFPMNALINSAMFGPVCQYAALQIQDEKAKAAIKSVCIEKCKAMFEDMLKLHAERD